MEKIEKIRKIAISLFIIIGLFSIFLEPKIITYTGTGEGFDSNIVATIKTYKTKGGKIRITDITLKHGDTEALATPALDKIAIQLKNTQNIEKIDTVAGATYSSLGAIEALKDALNKAK